MSKPLHIVYLSGEAQPLKLDHNDRRCIWCGHSEHEPTGCEACHPADSPDQQPLKDHHD